MWWGTSRRASPHGRCARSQWSTADTWWWRCWASASPSSSADTLTRDTRKDVYMRNNDDITSKHGLMSPWWRQHETLFIESVCFEWTESCIWRTVNWSWRVCQKHDTLISQINNNKGKINIKNELNKQVHELIKKKKNISCWKLIKRLIIHYVIYLFWRNTQNDN